MPAGAATSAGFLLGAGLRSRVGCPKTKPTDQAHANDDATCGSIRLKFLKIEALVRISARRIKIAMAAACPAADEWGLAARRAHLTRVGRGASIARHHQQTHGTKKPNAAAQAAPPSRATLVRPAQKQTTRCFVVQSCEKCELVGTAVRFKGIEARLSLQQREASR